MQSILRTYLGHVACLILLILSFCGTGLNAQQIIWSDDFSTDQGTWISAPFKCDGNAFTMAVVNEVFRWQDIEGDCCNTNSGNNRSGRNNSILTSIDIDLQGACKFTISFDYAWGDRLECYNPARTMDSCGSSDFGQDQFWFEYSLDGGDWIPFFSFCESGNGARSFTSPSIERGNTVNLKIRIIGGVQAADEWFTIDNVEVTSSSRGVDISVPSFELCLDEEPISLPSEIDGVMGVWMDPGGNQITQIDPMTYNNGSTGMVSANFNPMGACTNQSTYVASVSIINCSCPLYRVELVRNESLDIPDCNDLASYRRDVEYRVVGADGGIFKWFLLQEDSVSLADKNRSQVPYSSSILLDGLFGFNTDGSRRNRVLLVVDETASANCSNGEDSIFIQIPPYDFASTGCRINHSIEIDNVRCNTQSTQSLGDDQIVFDVMVSSVLEGSFNIEVTDRNNSGAGSLSTSQSIIEFNKMEQITIDIGSNQLVRPQLQAFDLDGNPLTFSNLNDFMVPIPNPNVVVFDESNSNAFEGISNVRCDTNGTSDPSDDVLIFDIAATGVYGSFISESEQVFNGKYRLDLLSPEVQISAPTNTVFDLTEINEITNPIRSEVQITLNGGVEWPQDITLSVVNDTVASCDKIITVQNVCAEMDMTIDTSTIPNDDDSLLISIGSCSNDTFFYEVIDSTCSRSMPFNGFIVDDAANPIRSLVFSPELTPIDDYLSRTSNDTVYFEFFDILPDEYLLVLIRSNCRDTFSFEVPNSNPDLLTFDPTYTYDCDSAYYNFNFRGTSQNAEFLILINSMQDTLVVDSVGAFVPEPPHFYSFMIRDKMQGCQTELKNLNGNPTSEIYNPPFYEFDILPNLTCVVDQNGDNQKQLNYRVSPVDNHAPAADSFRLYTLNGEIDQWFNINDGIESFIVSPVFSSDTLFLADAKGCFISAIIDTSVNCPVACNLSSFLVTGSDVFDCEKGGQARLEVTDKILANVFVFVNNMRIHDSLVSLNYTNQGSTIVTVTGIDTGDADVILSLDPLGMCPDQATRLRFSPDTAAFSLFVLDTLECERWTTTIDVLQNQGSQRDLVYMRIDDNGENRDTISFSNLILFDTIDFQLMKEPDSLFITVQDPGRFCPYTVSDTVVFDKPKRINFLSEPVLSCSGPNFILSFAVDTADYGFDSYWLIAEDGSLNMEIAIDTCQRCQLVVDSNVIGMSLRLNLLNANQDCQDFYQFDALPDCNNDCGLVIDKTLTQPQCRAARLLSDWEYVLPGDNVLNTNPDTSKGFVVIYDSVRSAIFPYGSPVPVPLAMSKQLMPGDVIYIEDELNPDCRDSIIVGQLENCCETVIYPNVGFTTVADTCSRGLGQIQFEDLALDQWRVNWSVGLEQFDSMLLARNVFAGMHTAMVTNKLQGCDSVLTFEITVANASSLNAFATVVAHPSSETSNDGVIRVGCTDCSLPYTIEIDGMSYMVNQADTVFQNLIAGTYPILVRDGGINCEFLDTLVLDPGFCDSVRNSLIIEETSPATQDGNFRNGIITIRCPLCPNGEFEVFLNGQTEGRGTNGVYVIDMLADGIYDLDIIVDANCSIDTMFEVTRCESYNTDRTVIQPTCSNLFGQIILTDLPPYPVITLNSQDTITGDIIDSLSAGRYIIVVNDTVLSDICYPDYVDTVDISSPSNYVLGMTNVRIDAGQSITLTANDPGIDGFSDYYWALNGVPICNAPCLSTVVTPTDMTTTYEFVINSNQICNGPFMITVEVRDPSAGIEAPNTFDRGDYAEFYIEDNPDIIEVIETFSVYNRWGSQLFQNTNIPGGVFLISVGLNFRDQQQFNPNQTYTYHMKVRLTDGNTRQISGTFIILE